MLTSLAAFLKDIHSVGKTQTISPSHLFGQVGLQIVLILYEMSLKSVHTIFEYARA